MTTSVHEHPFDSTSFRKALSRFATGIAVVSVAADDNGPAIGLTINSFSSVSLEPPLVLWCLDKHSDTCQRFLRSPHFAVSLLKAEHGELAKKLAKPGKHEIDVETEVWQTGAPILKDALAAFDCTVEHRYEGGDHIIYVGRVVKIGLHETHQPLLYFAGGYRTLKSI